MGAIDTLDRLQCCMPFMALSPSWCHMGCQHAETRNHLFFPCFFAVIFWVTVLLTFGWFFTCPNSVFGRSSFWWYKEVDLIDSLVFFLLEFMELAE